MKIRDITDIIEEFAPLEIQESWDNSGLIIGSGETEVTGVVVGFDCTPELIDEAVGRGANLVITHHPLIFRGVCRIAPDDVAGRTIIEAVKNDIAVYAAHTNADKVISGVSGAMAERLGLCDPKILDYGETHTVTSIRRNAENGFETETMNQMTGLGVIGRLEKPVSAGVMIDMVKDKFGLKVLRASEPIARKIEKVAVCGGAGASLIETAIRCGADLYISGDISYHNFFLPEDFMIMDIGHFESEIEITSVFYSLIRKKIPNLAVYVADDIRSKNPVHYY